MKKTLILILILSFTITSVLAQKERKRVLIFNSGVSLPFSDFAIKKMEAFAGFAGTGFNAGIDYLSSKGGFLGFIASTGYSIMNFDSKAYKSEYDRILDQDGEVAVNAGNYNFFRTTVGLSGRITEINAIDIKLFIQAGISLSMHPEIIVIHSRFGIINSVKQDWAWASTSGAGLKINYNFSENYAVSFGYSLNLLYPGFNDEGPHSHFNLPVRFANFNLGFLIVL
jgi:opacity protein-like surface antigen